MATARLVLRKDTKNSDGKSLIFLQYCYKSRITLFSTNQKVEPEHWNPKDQKVKKTVYGFTSLNAVIHQQKEKLETLVREAQFNNVNPDIDFIRESFKKKEDKDPALIHKRFLDHFKDFIEVCKNTKKKRTITNYTVMYNHLVQFEMLTNKKIRFEGMNLQFYEKFISYSINHCMHTNNTIGKNIVTLKTFLNYAFDKKLHSYLDYKKIFKGFNEDTDLIYLTEKELMRIVNLDLSKSLRLSKARDLFTLCCFTGLRFSDVIKIKTENIKDGTLIIRTQKTNSNLTIQLNDFALEILGKYHSNGNYYLPKISNQKLNDYLKEIAFLADLNDDVVLTKNSGSTRIEKLHKKHQLVSTHTGRRTFVTLSLEKGMRPEVLMSITGHRNLKTLQKYIKIVDKVKSSEMMKVWNVNIESKVALAFSMFGNGFPL